MAIAIGRRILRESRHGWSENLQIKSFFKLKFSNINTFFHSKVSFVHHQFNVVACFVSEEKIMSDQHTVFSTILLDRWNLARPRTRSERVKEKSSNKSLACEPNSRHGLSKSRPIFPRLASRKQSLASEQNSLQSLATAFPNLARSFLVSPRYARLDSERPGSIWKVGLDLGSSFVRRLDFFYARLDSERPGSIWKDRGSNLVRRLDFCSRIFSFTLSDLVLGLAKFPRSRRIASNTVCNQKLLFHCIWYYFMV